MKLDYARCQQEKMAWAADYIQPINCAMYAGKLEQARQLHIQAHRALERAELLEEVQEALGYHLLFIHYSIYWMGNPQLWNVENYREVKRVFEQPAATSFGDIERLKRLMTIRYHADQDMLEPLANEDITVMLDELQGYPDATTWFYAAGWAFRHGDLAILERAYTETLIDPAHWMGQAKWQRINLMYLLTANRATRRDVLETIKTIAILPQLIEFERAIWPKCQSSGLIDDEIERLLAARAEQIRANIPEPPGMEPRTKRLRRDLD